MNMNLATATAEYEEACRDLERETPESVERAKRAVYAEREAAALSARERDDQLMVDMLAVSTAVDRQGAARVAQWVKSLSTTGGVS
jgi:hypothetical protein